MIAARRVDLGDRQRKRQRPRRPAWRRSGGLAYSRAVNAFALTALWLALAAPAGDGPLLSVQCPDAIAEVTWQALSDAMRRWGIPDVEIDVVCHPNGAGRIETRLRGQRAIAEMPPREFGGPDRVVEIAEAELGVLVRALGGTMRAPPRWVLQVGAGARVVGLGGSLPLTLSFQLDRRLGVTRERGFLRFGLGGSAGAVESDGRSVAVIGTSAFALFGVRAESRRWALDGGLGMRLGLITLEGASGSLERPEDTSGVWYGPILQGGAGWRITRRGTLRLGIEAGYGFDGPVGRPDAGAGFRHDGGWIGLDLALAMAF